jgi:hypothetical protein
MNLDKQYSKILKKGARHGKHFYKILFRNILYAKKPNFFPSNNIEVKSQFPTAQARDEGNWK